ncbi:MAG: hypothetical protein AB8B59_06210 [Maribacter sp.]
MKFNALLLVTTIFFIGCSNDKKTTEIPKQVSKLKSDVLLLNSAMKPFSRAGQNDLVYLSLSGKSILKSTATFKAINAKGQELYCETFPVSELIKPEYKTANSSLKEAHIRDIVTGFFVDNLDFQNKMDDTLAGL